MRTKNDERWFYQKQGFVKSVITGFMVLAVLFVSFGSVSAEETPAISDSEQFIRWHSTAFGTGWYLNNYVQSVIQAEDGSYVSVGFTSPYQNNSIAQHAYMTKFNQNGSIAWDTVFGGGADGQGTASPNTNYRFLKVIQLANGDFLGIGQTDDNLGMAVNGYQNIFAVRVSNEGNVIWQKAYGVQDRETNVNAWGAAENVDGSIVVWGSYWNRYNDYDRGYHILVELNLSGDGNLNQTNLITDDFGNDSTIDATDHDMKKTADGGYLAYQNICTSGALWTDTLVKLNASGQREWGLALIPKESSTGYGSSRVQNSSICVLPDGYLIAGITTVAADGGLSNAPIVYKLDLAGNVQWTKVYQHLTLNNQATDIFACQTADNNVILSIVNGYSTTDFTAFKVASSDGSIQWAKSYGNTTGFERGYGGNAFITIKENSVGQLLGVGNGFITKFSGDGSVAFVTEKFTTQVRDSFNIIDIEANAFTDAGAMMKFTFSGTMSQKDLSLLTGLTAQDSSAVGEPATLQSIAITTPASKLQYQVGEALDLSGLVVTGTYSNGTSKVETITADNISGFDSSAAAINQVLTITVGDKTTTFTVQIVGSSEPGVGVFTGFLGQDPYGSYFLYNKEDFNNSFLAYQINPSLPSAKMYKHYLNNGCQIVALKDLNKGYMDYSAAASACLLAQMRGESFDINSYFGRSDAKLYDEAVSNVGIVDQYGNVTY
ncbi:bacterial Ig-like domain-containing protein [Acetobacterium sp. MES1]|uniref:bacterial Ig-like domain-containing protein n=1 Tax=Acetobacterium sp. MES1 TaxID=1899015 RepID=UPI0025809424|nr:bacterial Ig-like domain-containing protein [Acetobacterium sp. MES1]